ncbi:MAG TPA: phosphomannomutase [Holosporales bacterium]|nr:phosphomannomutase [Holosporales bacterium]
MLDSSIFREYDIRGVVGKDFDEAGVILLGQAFATKVKRMTGGSTLVLGYDGRLSSPDLEAALIKGFKAAGAEVISIGCGPTPLLYFASHHFKAHGALMITGSHNPPEYNGFKMVIDQQALFGSEIQELETLIKTNALITNQGAGSHRVENLHNDYVQRLISDFTTHYSDINVRVAWDPGNGATGEVVQDLLAQIEGEHYLINGEIDGTFPAHHPDPTVEENLEQLIELVDHMDCDFGIAFDGDGDRIGVVDDKGRILFGDQLMALFSEEVLASHPKATIIADVKTSQRLFDYVKELGGEPLMWRTGHSLIKKKMREVGSPLAGEMSGHIFFADRYYGYDDALYAALRFIGIINAKGIKLSQWVDELPPVFNTPEIRIPCDNLDKFAIAQAVQTCLDQDGVAYSGVDGVRVSTEKGWWLLRASNTQEILVARAEANSQDELDKSLDAIENYLKRVGLEQ